MTIKYPPSYLLPQPNEKNMNRHLTDMIIKYEQDLLDDDDTISLFQELIDNGMAWRLQGHYGRMATRLIEAGLCTKKKNK